MWWLGQSGFLVKTNAGTVLFDPYLSDSLTDKYADTDKPHVRMTELCVNPDRMTGIDIVNVDLEPGDLLIFNALLAHGVRPNHSDDRVRMAQYISMHPADYDNVAEREERIRLWRELDYPKRDAFPGDPRDWEKKNAQTAKLNPLGEKLLGLKPW